MKKVLVIAMLVVMAVSTLVGCGAAETKTGLGIVMSVGRSTSATADAEGAAIGNCSIASVTLDKDNKIVSVSIDGAETEIAFTTAGAITTDLTAALKTRKELGDDYGMKKYGSAIAEWYEQIASLEAWMVGKTVAQVQAMGVDEEGVPTETDLTSSVTITVTDYVAAVVKAAANAK